MEELTKIGRKSIAQRFFSNAESGNYGETGYYFWGEPTNSLDENGVNEIRTIIKQERDRGALILLSSHNNDDIMELADKVYKMESGEIKEWNNEKS